MKKEDYQNLIEAVTKVLPHYARQGVVTCNNMKTDSITGLLGFCQMSIEHIEDNENFKKIVNTL